MTHGESLLKPKFSCHNMLIELVKLASARFLLSLIDLGSSLNLRVGAKCCGPPPHPRLIWSSDMAEMSKGWRQSIWQNLRSIVLDQQVIPIRQDGYFRKAILMIVERSDKKILAIRI